MSEPRDTTEPREYTDSERDTGAATSITYVVCGGRADVFGRCRKCGQPATTSGPCPYFVKQRTDADAWAGLVDRRDARIASLESENARLRAGATKENEEICQLLGRALGYPRFEDDQKNFPGATDDDGVCVGDEVAVTLAMQAARELADLRERLSEVETERDEWEWALRKACDPHVRTLEEARANQSPEPLDMTAAVGMVDKLKSNLVARMRSERDEARASTSPPQETEG